MKRLFLLIILSVVSVVLAACGSNEENASGEGTGEKVRIGYINVMDDAPAMVAEDAGYYEEEGLDAELVLFDSGTDLIKAIVNGDLDAGVLGATNAVSWAAQGADLKIVGGAQMGYHSILVNEDSGIQSIEDLKGKRLATQKQGSTADIVLNGVTLTDAGLTRDDIEMTYVSPAVAVQSLQAGRVDAAFLFEPYDRLARIQGGVRELYEIGAEWPFPCMVVITSGDAADNNRDVVNKILDAQSKAVDLLENDPAQAAELITYRFTEEESYSTPNGEMTAEEVITEAIQAQTFDAGLNQEQIGQIQAVADLMVDQDVLEEPFDVESILDLSWQEEQNKE
ncbi:ABC transporter substrate-binding protein [Bacillus fonticola]|uniref:ABC transporter substrate-binding protein n=1 Tax=Bacillus fonticola TaxID=2728853 RepID=UPI00147667F3|nr:ABC transporter substrate-binding protein [Bacillus fonticola]